ncbi:MAG: YCF48-related protein, partial [Cytophagaceae bacterium]|nr:YCF48-related protein [Cytophagaceae bacterium]
MIIRIIALNIFLSIFLSCSMVVCDEKTSITGEMKSFTMQQFFDPNYKLRDTFFLRNNNFSGDILAVDFFDNNVGVISGIDGLLYRTEDAGKTFSKINLPIQFSKFDSYDIEIVSKNIGFVVFTLDNQDGVILKTIDKGITWTQLGSSRDIWRTIEFQNELVGYVGGGIRFSVDSNEGIIFKTTNGGESWSQIHISGLATVRSISIQENFVYVSCSSGKFFKSMDFGASWTEISLPNPNNDIPMQQYLVKSSFVNKDEGFLIYNTVFNNDVFVFKTRDGGNSWEESIISSKYESFLNYCFFSNVTFGNNKVMYMFGGRVGNKSS